MCASQRPPLSAKGKPPNPNSYYATGMYCVDETKHLPLPVKSKPSDPYSYYATCMFCADESGHLEVNRRTGVYYCHRCGKGGKFHITGLHWIPRVRTPRIALDIRDTITGLNLHPCRGNCPHEQYLARRGLTPAVIHELRAHEGTPWWRVYFPIYNRDGETVYFVGRRILEKGSPKYWYPAGMGGKSYHLWGLHHVPERGRVILVEGILDAVWSFRRLAVLGSSISDNQIQLLRDLDPIEITIALDGDATHPAHVMARKISQHMSVPIYIAQLDANTDPCDLREQGDNIIDTLARRVG